MSRRRASPPGPSKSAGRETARSAPSSACTWQATEGMWRDLGAVSVDAELGRRVAEGVAEELGALGGRDEVKRRRDEALLALLRLKAEART